MAIWKKEATECKTCKVELTKDNKQLRRAVCKDCYKEEYKHAQLNKKVNREESFHTLYNDIKIEKRREIHAEVNQRLKQCVTKEQRQEFFETRFNEIQNDELLWKFLNRNTQRSKLRKLKN